MNIVDVGTGPEFFTATGPVTFRQVGKARVFKILYASSKLLSVLAFETPVVCILQLDWTQTKQWHEQIDEMCLGTKNYCSKLIFTTINFSKLPTRHLDTGVDKCHQYLRTQALKHHACLIYSLDDSIARDWLQIAAAVLTNEKQRLPPQKLYGSDVAVYEDSKEQILAVSDKFDFELALANKIDLPVFTERSAHKPHLEDPNTVGKGEFLPYELARVISEHSETGSVTTIPQVAVENDIISAFLDTIAAD